MKIKWKRGLGYASKPNSNLVLSRGIIVSGYLFTTFGGMGAGVNFVYVIEKTG